MPIGRYLYRVLKDQSHGIKVLQKDSPNAIQFLDCKKTEHQYNSISRLRQPLPPQNRHALNKNKSNNIAGRLPENSRNRFVDRQSKKTVKKDRPKKFVFSLKTDL